jgi:hypothetical protein
VSKSRPRSIARGDGAIPVRPLNVGILPNLLGYNVRRAHMALWRDFTRTVGTAIVRPGIFSMLVLIGENPGVAQIEIRCSGRWLRYVRRARRTMAISGKRPW